MAMFDLIGASCCLKCYCTSWLIIDGSGRSGGRWVEAPRPEHVDEHR